MDNDEIKQKAAKLKEVFLKAVDLAEEIEKSHSQIPDAIYFLALASLVSHHKDSKTFKDAQLLVEHIQSETKRLTSN